MEKWPLINRNDSVHTSVEYQNHERKNVRFEYVA